MRRLLLLVLALLASAIPARGQSTTVSGTITDQGGQAWFAGTVQFTFRPSNSNPTAQYFWNGAPFDKNTTIPVPALQLDGSGSFSGVSVPSNNFITPSGSTWTVQVTPASTTPSFSQNLTITGATQNISAQIIPPAISLNLSVPLLGARAYTDSEVSGALPGTLYFNNTDNLLHVCLLTGFPPCTWFPIGGGSGTITGSGASGQVAVFSGPTAIAGDPNFTWSGASVGLTVNATNAAQIVLLAGNDGLDIDGGSAALNASESGATASLHGNAGVGITSTTGNVTVGGAGAATGIVFPGFTSGSASIGPAAVAGTPNRINLPTTTGASGQALITNGGNPQQTSWGNVVTSVTGTANQITSSGGLTPVLSIPSTFIAPGSIQATTSVTATSVTDSGLTNGDCVQAGTGGLLTTITKPCLVSNITLISLGTNTSVCSTTNVAGNTCTTTVTISPTQPDTNYIPLCMGAGATQFPFILGTTSLTTTSITVEITNGQGNQAQVSTFASLGCAAIHQ